jgi:RNA polymerase sigma factor (sigma-70 family)
LEDAPSPKQKWEPTREDFARLLAWLNDDPDKAATSYEEIRANLIKSFRRLRCRSSPEDLTDLTINRVAWKLPEIQPTYVGDPAPYFYSVGFNIYREDLRTPETVPLPEDALTTPATIQDKLEASDTPEAKCLLLCVPQLKQRDQVVVVNYYRGEKGEKIRLRKELAEQLGVPQDALRRLAQRARKKLKKLIKHCLRKKFPTYVAAGSGVRYR